MTSHDQIREAVPIHVANRHGSRSYRVVMDGSLKCAVSVAKKHRHSAINAPSCGRILQTKSEVGYGQIQFAIAIKVTNCYCTRSGSRRIRGCRLECVVVDTKPHENLAAVVADLGRIQ